MPERRLLRDAIFLAVVFAGGYLATTLWVSPTPIGARLAAREQALPRVLGLPADSARAALEALGLRVRLDGARPHPAIARGAIAGQDPAPGTALGAGASVRLVASAGPEPVVVPDVAGFPAALARQVIAAAGLHVGAVDTVPATAGGAIGADSDDAAAAAGADTIVVVTRPAAGQPQAAGAAVDLVVSVPSPGAGPDAKP